MRIVKLRDRNVSVHDVGQGTPMVYLHGFADLHGVTEAPLPFHDRVGARRRLIAPAHPGCAGSDEDDTLESIEDLVFHTIETFDAMGLGCVDLLGACIGGWLATEIAVRHPERVNRLVLLGASGLFVPGQPVADLFMAVQPRDGTVTDLRAMLFAEPEGELALGLLPDRMDPAANLLRFKAMRFAARVGFQPPYFHHRKLRDRLHRYSGPVMVLHGASDRMVPSAHAEAYAAGFGQATLALIEGRGHCPHHEDPVGIAGRIREFLGG